MVKWLQLVCCTCRHINNQDPVVWKIFLDLCIYLASEFIHDQDSWLIRLSISSRIPVMCGLRILLVKRARFFICLVGHERHQLTREAELRVAMVGLSLV